MGSKGAFLVAEPGRDATASSTTEASTDSLPSSPSNPAHATVALRGLGKAPSPPIR